MKASTNLPESKSRLSTKGQLVIPKEIRERHGWTAGVELIFEDLGGDRVVLRQGGDLPPTRLADLIGCTGYRGPAKSLEEMEAGVALGARRSR